MGIVYEFLLSYFHSSFHALLIFNNLRRTQMPTNSANTNMTMAILDGGFLGSPITFTIYLQ
jgi:hypothetical protein